MATPGRWVRTDRRIADPISSEGQAMPAPSLVLNPRSDARFVDAATLQATLAATPAALVQRLRGAYPKVVVHARSLSGESNDTWYVYRDGAWVPPEG